MEKFDLGNFPTSESAKKMLRYVSDGFYDKSYVGKWIFQVMGAEYDKALETAMDLPAQFFPETATWGLMYHEIKWGLSVRPNISYEERRKRIYQKRDCRGPMTPYYMEKYLQNLTGFEVHVSDVHDIGAYGFMPVHPNVFQVVFIGEGTLNARLALEAVRKIKQSHTDFLAMEYISILFLVCIGYENRLTMVSSFYPRCNMPELFLDGKEYLDGGYLLNGYQNMQDMETFCLDGEGRLDGRYGLDGLCEIQILDYYPVRLLIRGDFQQNIIMSEWLHYLLKILLSLYAVPAMRTGSCFYPRYNVPLFRLDGTKKLDGAHFLNETNQDFQQFFLDGEGCLDGGYILNGYMDSDNFDFYPARLQISGDFQLGTGLSGQLRPVASVQLLPVSGASDILMSGSFYPRYSPPSLYLGGGEKLDGDRTLNGYMESDNIPPCSLNGEAGLDGEYALNGYKNNQSLGFYPLNILVNGCFTQNITLSGEPRLLSDARLSIQNDGCFGVRESAGVKTGTGNIVQMCTGAREKVSAGRGKLTVEKDLWYLEGRQQLDGQVRLDADSYQIQL